MEPAARPQSATAAAVVDASPLIVLRQVGLLDLLNGLFSHVSIPDRVANEVKRTVEPFPDWLAVVSAPEWGQSLAATERLDPGERDAIALALAVHPHYLVVDDLDARRIAERLSLPIVGTVGLLVQAKHAGLIARVEPQIKRLKAAGLFVGDDIRRRALRLAEE